MKQTLLILASIAMVGVSFSKHKPFVPPGTVQINDTLFADETEITNFAWQEFEFWTKATYGTKSKQHLAILPDTLVWKNKLSYNEPYVNYYYRHVAYKNFPIVGISYEQAVAFCNWRTTQVQIHLGVKKEFKNQHVTYRLPTKQEWELFGAPTQAFHNNGKNEKGKYQLNCVHHDTITKAGPPYADVTAPVTSYWINSFGIYNTAGNVAEMLLEKGICKGGSWRDQLEDCRPGKDASYAKPEAWLGFRCVCIKKI